MKRPPLEKNIDKAAAWLRAAIAAEPDPEVVKRLRGAFDALNRYRWMASDLGEWWQRRDVDAPAK